MYSPPLSTSSFSYTLAILNSFLQPTTTFSSDELTRVMGHLDEWTISRLTVVSPSSNLQNRFVVARLFRGIQSSESVDLRLESPKDNLPRLFDAVAFSLNALSTSTGCEETSIDIGDCPSTLPTTPNEYPLAITFSLVPNSQVTVSIDTEEEILYQVPNPADEEFLTLLTLVRYIKSTACAGEFVQHLIDTLKRRNYSTEWSQFVNHSDLSDSATDNTEERDEDDFLDDYLPIQGHPDLGLTIQHPEPIGSIDTSEDGELSFINKEFQCLSELRLQLAADLRSSLWDAEQPPCKFARSTLNNVNSLATELSLSSTSKTT